MHGYIWQVLLLCMSHQINNGTYIITFHTLVVFYIIQFILGSHHQLQKNVGLI